MVGHCAGLRNSQRLGDFVLAHAYLREDHVLDDDLPVWVPIPALAEIQLALLTAVADVTEPAGYELTRIMRTSTVATIDNRNWALRPQAGPAPRPTPTPATASSSPPPPPPHYHRLLATTTAPSLLLLRTGFLYD